MATWDTIWRVLSDWTFTEEIGGIWEVTGMAAVVYIAAMVVVRLGKKRLLGRSTVLDAILGFMLGATLSRAINSEAPLFHTVAAALVLVGAHWLFGNIVEHSGRAKRLLTGKPEVVVRDGKMDEQAMHRHNVSTTDVEEAVFLSGHEDVSSVRLARFERNGAISVVPQRKADVIEVKVEEGVQTVRVVVEGR